MQIVQRTGFLVRLLRDGETTLDHWIPSLFDGSLSTICGMKNSRATERTELQYERTIEMFRLNGVRTHDIVHINILAFHYRFFLSLSSILCVARRTSHELIQLSAGSRKPNDFAPSKILRKSRRRNRIHKLTTRAFDCTFSIVLVNWILNEVQSPQVSFSAYFKLMPGYRWKFIASVRWLKRWRIAIVTSPSAAETETSNRVPAKT